jgi:hypothetical protein
VKLDHPIVASEVMFRFANTKMNQMQLGAGRALRLLRQ